MLFYGCRLSYYLDGILYTSIHETPSKMTSVFVRYKISIMIDRSLGTVGKTASSLYDKQQKRQKRGSIYLVQRFCMWNNSIIGRPSTRTRIHKYNK